MWSYQGPGVIQPDPVEAIHIGKCALCGHERTPECGYATVNGRFICHPDDDRTSDCYVLHTIYGHRLQPVGEERSI